MSLKTTPAPRVTDVPFSHVYLPLQSGPDTVRSSGLPSFSSSSFPSHPLKQLTGVSMRAASLHPPCALHFTPLKD